MVFCATHSDKPIEFYCSDCDEAICNTCQVVKHKNHDIVTVDDALSKMVTNIEHQLKLIEKKSSETAQNLEKLDKHDQNIKSKFGDAYQKIDAEANRRIQEIKQKQEGLKHRLSQDEKMQVKFFGDEY